MADPIILVTGATGRQGGAVARALLSAGGFRVRALTRDPSSGKAAKLKALGAELVKGDLEDRAQMAAAVSGAQGLFSVQDPWAHGVEGEIRQGKALAEVAAEAKVGHVVYASVSKADEPTGVPHFESKGQIERHHAQLGLPTTALRPAFFMDMLVPSERQSPAMWGALRQGLGTGGRVQLVAVADIARAAVAAFQDPGAWAGRAIELASEALTVPEAARQYREVMGRRPFSLRIPFFLLRFINREAEINFRWIGERGWTIDVEKVRERFPGMLSFRAFLQAQARA
ncbi:MAG TPA: NmrA/HSCARG family protein [Myxococcales bacterium]|jgi:uncharacterized protein YbjT (DUF2867 family)|nr:NmrA/HSCARG family protein [Myxococcales bacterium]